MRSNLQILIILLSVTKFDVISAWGSTIVICEEFEFYGNCIKDKLCLCYRNSWYNTSFGYIRSVSSEINAFSDICDSCSSHCRKFISCGSDCLLKIFDVETQTEMVVKNLGYQIHCVVWCNNLSLILCGTDLGQLEVWDGDKATLVSAVKGHSAPVASLEVRTRR